MASDWEDFCNAVITDLQGNVRALADVHVHPLIPYDPEELSGDGDRHLSVFPVADQAQLGQPLVTDGGMQLVEVYRILYWEPADGESSRGVADVVAAQALLDLAQAVKDRFFKRTNVFLGGTELTRYIGTAFPDRSGQVRWFTVGVEARRSQSLT